MRARRAREAGMGRAHNQKIKLLVLLDILRMRSDENKPMTTNEILTALAAKGIPAERKALYADIRLLNEYGYEVGVKRGRSNEYALIARDFDAAELRILIDAVSASRFITKRKTQDLAKRIANLAGMCKGDVLMANTEFLDSVKHSNEKIYYYVDRIATAIERGKKVEFKYFDLDWRGRRAYRKNGDTYVVNPIRLIIDDGKYYLICSTDKYRNAVPFRLDRMDSVEIQAAPLVEYAESAIDISEIPRCAFSMFMGEDRQSVSFVARKGSIGAIYDKFGEDLKFCQSKDDEDKVSFVAEVCVSPIFFGWCASFGTDLTIAAPDEVRRKYVEFLSDILKDCQS